MLRRALVVLLLAVGSGLGLTAHALDDDGGVSPAGAASVDGGVVLLPGTYQGVALPGGENLPPRAPHLPLKGAARVTWPGFQVREGVPTVFVELTQAVEWSVVEGPESIVYVLKKASVPLKNNRRPLKVTDFGTAVREVETRQKGHDVQVIIHVSHKLSHREHLEDAAGGFKLLVIELI